jgi:hypothetical protein
MISHQMQNARCRKPASDTALSGGLSAEGELTRRFCAHVQFKTFGYHDYGLRAVSALPHCEFEGLSSVDKQAAAQTAGVLDDPVSVTVFADQEGRERWAARRRRFTFAHGYIRLLLRQERRLRRQPRGLPLRRIAPRRQIVDDLLDSAMLARVPHMLRSWGQDPQRSNCARAHMNSREIKIEFHKKRIWILGPR